MEVKPNAKIVWLRGRPSLQYTTKSKKGQTWELLQLTFHDKKESFSVQMDRAEGEWWVGVLETISVKNQKLTTFQMLKNDFETHGFTHFELFWQSKAINQLKSRGLLVL